MILWQELIEQTKGPRIATIQQTHRFSYELVFPFDDNRPDGRTSHEVFVELIEEVNNSLNATEINGQDWSLGISTPGADVEHQFLQGNGPAFVRTWGAGETAIMTHYCSMTLDILVVVCGRHDEGS